MPRPKIAVLYIGGSIGMVRNQKNNRIEPIESLSEIHRFLPEAQKDVSLDFVTVSNLGSSEVTPTHWIEIAQAIEKKYNQCEGFVVIHGSNTMSYTASALSFALQGLSKPVVLTGSLMPINELGSDARTNLVFAIKAAQLDIAEVVVAMGPRVLRGTRAKKVDQSILQTFDSPNFPPLAEFDVSVHMHPWRMVRRKRTLEVQAAFDPNVVSITLHPGMPLRYFDTILDAQPHGIILRAYGLGMLPEHLFPWLKEVKKRKIPTVITSQMIRGTIDLHLYRKQIALEDLGVISGKNMTNECAAAKLMWALAQTKDPRRLREVMEKSLVGELDEN